MKKLSRILALSLAIVMILSGCGAQTQEPAKTEEPTTQPSQTTPATTTPSTQPAQTTPTEPKTDDTQSVPAMSLGTKEYSFENVSSAVFNTKLEGDSVAATSEVVNGAYRIAASRTDGESWHLKLESTLATNPGSTYRVTFDFDSDTAGTVKFGDNQSFTIEKGRNTVTGNFKADGDNKYIDLQLGALAPFVLDLYEIKVEEYSPDGLGSTATIGGALRETVTEQHDGGYEVHLTAAETGAKLNIAAAPASDRGVWKAKMLINTGAALEAGKTYRVSLNVGAEKSQSEYEVCFDGTSENAYGALYGRSLTAGGTDRIEYLVTPERSAGELVLRLQLGKTNSASGNVISVSGLKVEEVNVSYRSVTPAITYGTFEAVSEQHADTFTQRLERNSDSAVLRIDAVPEKGEVYESKLLIHTGVTPEAGKSYAVSFSVASAKETEYEISYNKASQEKGYGAQYGEKLASGEKKTVEYTVAGTDGKGELTIQLMLGKSPAENAVTVSDVKVCEITEKGNVSVLPEAINYASVGNITSWLFDGYEASLDNTDTSATMTIEKTAQSREVWMAKLLADTGVVPEAGKSYRATFTVETNKALDYELCYNSGDVEKGYDVLYGQSLAANAKKTVERIITGASDDNGRLVIQLSVGNAAEGTKITISDIKVEELTSEYTDILPESFSFNSVLTEMRTGMNKIPTGYEDVLPTEFAFNTASVIEEHHDNDYKASITKTEKTAIFDITEAPASDRGVWKAKITVNTGVVPVVGKLYLVSFKLKADKAQDEYEILLNNNYAEFKGRNIAAGETDEFRYVLAPTSDNGELKIVFQLGKTNDTTGNKFTLSDLKIEEFTAAGEKVSDVAYMVNGNVWEWHADSVKQSAPATTGKAELHIKTTGNEKESWNSKLFIATGVTPEPSTCYRVYATVSATKSIGEYEIDFNKGETEKGYGAKYGLHDAGTYSYDFKSPESGLNELILQFMFGNSADNNIITVTDVKVVKLADGTDYETLSVEYPAAPIIGASKVDGIDGSAAETEVAYGKAQMRITAVPEGDGTWKTRLNVHTGIRLKQNVKYRITSKLHSAKAITNFEVLYSNGADEDPNYNNGGKGYSDWESYGKSVAANETVTLVSGEFTVGALSQYNELVLRYQLGLSPADNVVTVSDVAIEELAPNDGGNSVSNGAFKLEANSGKSAALSGDGKSASARIITAGEDWHVKLFANTGFDFDLSKSYKISLDIENAKNGTVTYMRPQGVYNEELYGKETIASDNETVSHYVSPHDAGTLQILAKIGNADGKTVKISNIKIMKLVEKDENVKTIHLVSRAPVSVGAAEGYAVTPSAENNSAKIHITGAPAEGREVWKAKLFVNTGVILEKGKIYRVSADVTANKEFGYEICYNTVVGDNRNEKGFGAKYGLTANSSKQRVSFIQAAVIDDAELALQFSVGNAEQGTTVTVSDIMVEEITKQNVTDHLENVDFRTNGHINIDYQPGYSATLDGGDKASVNISGVPADGREAWKFKLFIDTKAQLEQGESYLVKADVQCTSEQKYEICYNNILETPEKVEKALGARYELNAGTNKQTVEYIVNANKAAELIIQFSLGNISAPCTFTVSNVSVEKISYDTQYFDYEADVQGPISYWAHESYKASLSGADTGATLAITSLPTEGREPWKVKYFVDTLVRPKAGESYRVKLDVLSKIEQPFEICYNKGNEEKGYGAVYGLTAPAGEKKSYEKIITIPEDMNYLNNLVLQLSLGNATAENEITVSNLVVEKIGFTGGTDALTKPISYVTGSSLDFWAHEDYEASVAGTGSAAVVNVNKTAENAEPWKIKLFVATGASLEAGKSYRVSASVAAEKAQGFELCFNNGAAEAGYGALYGLKAGEKSNVSGLITVPADIENASDLVLQFNLGNSESGNAITVSDIKVESVELTEGESVLPTAFSFASKSTVNGWAHEDYAVNLTDNGTSATMNITSVPATGREAWKVKMFVETGAHLTAGKTYRVRMDVSAQSAVNYEICYNNGAVEKGVGALYDLRAGANKSTVTATLTPNANSELIIQLSLGKAAGANAVTVSNVRVEELVTGGAKSVLPAEFKYVAAKEIDYATAEPTAVSSILFPQSVVWMYNAEGSASGTMSTAGGKITYNMTKISKSDGDNKITIPDVELKAGKTYTVTFKAKADKNIDCVFVLNRAGEWNTAIYENLGVGTEEKEYTFTTNALDADSAYELLWQFGSSKNNKLRTAEVEIRDVAIYSK